MSQQTSSSSSLSSHPIIHFPTKLSAPPTAFHLIPLSISPQNSVTFPSSCRPCPQQSLCAEMAEELCFAMRCRGSRQRPALKRHCTRCVPGVTYVPTGLEVPQINGNGVGGSGLSCGKAVATLIASN